MYKIFTMTLIAGTASLAGSGGVALPELNARYGATGYAALAPCVDDATAASGFECRMTHLKRPVQLRVGQPGRAAPTLAQASLPATHAAPVTLLRTATVAVAASLKAGQGPLTKSPEEVAALVESTVLPLFDLPHMTRRVMARNWPLASSAQQDVLSDEFRAKLVRMYSKALMRYRGQLIEYQPLSVDPKRAGVTVSSTVQQRGFVPVTISYDMHKTPEGWKVHDVKIAGISLITTYRMAFAAAVRKQGLGGLVSSLSLKHAQARASTQADDSGMAATEPSFMVEVMTYAVRSHP